MTVLTATFLDADPALKEVQSMEACNAAIEVLDEGIKESVDNLSTCCKTGPGHVNVTK
jgi:hypothetical protein